MSTPVERKSIKNRCVLVSSFEKVWFRWWISSLDPIGLQCNSIAHSNRDQPIVQLHIRPRSLAQLALSSAEQESSLITVFGAHWIVVLHQQDMFPHRSLITVQDEIPRWMLRFLSGLTQWFSQAVIIFPCHCECYFVDFSSVILIIIIYT